MSNGNSQAAIFAARATCELKRAETRDGRLTADPQKQLRSKADCGIWSMQALMKVHLKSQCQYRLDGAGSWWVRFRHARKSCFVESTLGYFNDDTNRKISNHWCVLVLWTRLDVVYFPQLILQELKEEKDQFLLLKSRTKRNSCMRWTSTLEGLVRFSLKSYI